MPTLVWQNAPSSRVLCQTFTNFNTTTIRLCGLYFLLFRYNFSSLEQTRNCSFWWNDDDEGLNRSQNNYQIVPCTSWVYSSSSVFTKTIASDFNLVCSDDYKRKLSQSIFMVGVTFGCVFWGEMSDR